MRFRPFNVDTNRLWFSLLLIILFILLFISPRPEGTLFLVLRILVVLGVLFVLGLYVMGPEGPRGVFTGRQGSTSRDLPEPGRKMQVDVRDYYDKLLQVVFDVIHSLNDHFEGAVYMIDPGSSGFTVQGASVPSFSGFIDRENQLIQTVVGHDDTMLFQQRDIPASWSGLFAEQSWRGSECLMGIHIKYKNAAVGCLLILAEHISEIKERDRDIVADLGIFISQGLAKIEKIEDLLVDHEYQSRIIDLISKTDISMEPTELYEMVRTLARTFFSYDKLTISMLNSKKDLATVKLVDGFKDDIDSNTEFSIVDTLHGRPIRTATPVTSVMWEKDYKDKGRFFAGDKEKYNFMAVMGTPIRVGSAVLGGIVLERISARNFSDSSLTLLKSLADAIGTVLHRSQQYQLMHQYATHDGLTGLLNHKAFLDRFEEEISRSVRFNQDLILLVLDLDKFKRINDTYGHVNGDLVLTGVAQVMKKCIRNIDVLARYGGEEFAILLINSNKENALPVAERIVKSIARYDFILSEATVNITISIGLAQFPEDADQIKEMITKADQAMYASKARGGNWVTVFGDAR